MKMHNHDLPVFFDAYRLVISFVGILTLSCLVLGILVVVPVLHALHVISIIFLVCACAVAIVTGIVLFIVLVAFLVRVFSCRLWYRFNWGR